MVAFLQVAHAGAELLDHACALVAEHGGLVAGRICARRGEEVGVADAAGDEADEDFAVLRLRQVELLHLERLAEFFEYGSARLHTAILESAEGDGTSSMSRMTDRTARSDDRAVSRSRGQLQPVLVPQSRHV